MRVLVIIFLFVCSTGNAQGPSFDPYERVVLFEQFRSEDAPEGFYTSDSLLLIFIDTLPLYTLDESSGGRDLELVYYFYDNSKILRKIAFRCGSDGYQYFYFEGSRLKKARYVNANRSIRLTCYFTDEDNRVFGTEKDEVLGKDPGESQFYELLVRGRMLFSKFETFF